MGNNGAGGEGGKANAAAQISHAGQTPKNQQAGIPYNSNLAPEVDFNSQLTLGTGGHGGSSSGCGDPPGDGQAGYLWLMF
jgi:hypothetical protein